VVQKKRKGQGGMPNTSAAAIGALVQAAGGAVVLWWVVGLRPSRVFHSKHVQTKSRFSWLGPCHGATRGHGLVERSLPMWS